MRKIFLTLLFLLSGVILLNAQTGENPFAKYGFKKVRAYTSSKGEFEEFHDNKDIVEIGSVLFDTKINQVMGFLSFNSNMEFSAWGYSENGELGLSISSWISNQTIMNPDGSGKMTSYDKYLTSETVGDLGKKAFNIHTHPGSVNGLGGYGKPSPADVRNLKLNPNRPHYILSSQEGLTQYFVNGFYKKVNNVKGHY